MGKGIITDILGNGLYRVELIKDISNATSNKDNILDILNQLNNKIIEHQNEVEKLSELLIKKEIYLKELEKLQENIDDNKEEKLIWCADIPPNSHAYKLGIGQVIGLCEINDDTPNEGINIYPSYFNKAYYDSARDGILKNIRLLNPWSWFYNTCIQPGLRKWKPRYRYGRISNINYKENVCDVWIDYTYSYWKINGGVFSTKPDKIRTHSIKIKYMDCDSEAFSVNDEVLIEYNGNENNPLVIGFKDHPKECKKCWNELWDGENICSNHIWSFGENRFSFNTCTKLFQCADIAYDYEYGNATLNINKTDPDLPYLEIRTSPGDTYHGTTFPARLGMATNEYYYTLNRYSERACAEPDTGVEPPIEKKYKLYIDYDIIFYPPEYSDIGLKLPAEFWICIIDETYDREKSLLIFPDFKILLAPYHDRDAFIMRPYMLEWVDNRVYFYNHINGRQDIFDLTSCINTINKIPGEKILYFFFYCVRCNVDIYNIKFCEEYIDKDDEIISNK